MNRDLEIQKDSDYILRFECVGENNQPYVFDSDIDFLQLEFEDIEGKRAASPIEIDLTDVEYPIEVTIPYLLVHSFNSNIIKYKLILLNPTLQLVLLSGYIIYVE